MAADYIEIHVDETGDRGFSNKSSPYFCLAACAFRHSNARRVIGAMEALNRALGRPSKQPMHAAEHLKQVCHARLAPDPAVVGQGHFRRAARRGMTRPAGGRSA